MTIQKPSKVIYTLMVLPGRVRVNFIRGFSRPEANLYMDIPGPLRLPKTIIPSAWIFPQAFGCSRNCISEYMDFPSGPWIFQEFVCPSTWIFLRPLDFPEFVYPSTWISLRPLDFPRICMSEYMEFFFPPQFYTSIFLGELNHLFSKTWPCKKNMYNFDFGKKMNYTWIFKFLCIKTWFFGVGKIFWDFAFAPKNLSHPKKPSFYT